MIFPISVAVVVAVYEIREISLTGLLLDNMLLSQIRSYHHLHTQYSLVSLPWDSPLTWLATALLLDLGYYWYLLITICHYLHIY